MTKRRVAAAAFAAILALGIHAASASAWQITLTPPAPTTVDAIHVVVDEWFPAGPLGHCWEVVSTTCTLAAPDSVLITADIQHCDGAPGCFCTFFPVAFQVTCDFAPLPPGTYRAVYQERYLNPYDERNNPPREMLFTVSVPTPVLRRSWGRLKAIYR